MSLFSLNRIYKPNRHTPTPLTQTHTIYFPLYLGPASPTQTHSWDKLCEDFMTSKKKKKKKGTKKVRVIGCDGEKSWVQAAAAGKWMDG